MACAPFEEAGVRAGGGPGGQSSGAAGLPGAEATRSEEPRPRRIVRFVLLVLFSGPALAHAGQPLETETARLRPRGQFQFETTFEYQTSPEGFETAVPLAFEYGITNDLELLVEPVVHANIRPEVGRKAKGVGDLEITLTYLFFHERAWIPALALAGEVKIPTASDTLIGTGETDYSPFLIASKSFGSRWDTHVNFGYAILGEPPGVKLDNIFTYAAAAEYHLISHRLDIVGELVGNTSSSPTTIEAPMPGGPGSGEGPAVRARPDRSDARPGIRQAQASESGASTEAAGEEIAGLVGARYYIRPNLFLSIGASYDNNRAILIRPGVTVRFN